MPKPKQGPRVGGGPSNARSILANQASELFVRGRIRTTQSKAKQLRPYAEKIITKARGGGLHERRQVLAKLRDRDVVAYLFEDVAPRFADRPGGYTRILKLGPRRSDSTPMAIIELVDQGEGRGAEYVEASKEQRSRGLMGRLRRRFTGGGGPEADHAGDEPGPGDEVADVVEDVDEDAADEPGEEPGPDDDEEAGLTERPPPSSPAEEPSAPDEPTAGDPVEDSPDEPDAGAATGG